MVALVVQREQLQAFRDGDPQARKVVGEWLVDQLILFFDSRFGVESLGDLVQETMMDILGKLEQSPEEPEAFYRWAMSFAGMEARTVRRDVQRSDVRAIKLREHLAAAERRHSPLSAQLLRAEQWDLIVECLSQLPPRYREAIEHNLDGGSHRELAERAGIAEASARHRFYVALRLIRERIRKVRVTRSEDRTSPGTAA